MMTSPTAPGGRPVKSDSHHPHNNDCLRVLIADDVPVMRDRLAVLLAEIDGVELAGVAHDAASAVEAAGLLAPDVVVLDVRMPGGGLNALKQIKAQGAAPAVIMLTAYSFPQMKAKCLANGADHFFDKTTDMERFAETLRQMAGARSD